MSKLYNNNLAALGLFVLASFLTVIALLAYNFSQELFFIFPSTVILVIIAIALYMIYNIIKISQEIKNN